ncbi:MAG: hypothetical protein WCK39_10460 [Methanomassiliicoccales archaeon]
MAAMIHIDSSLLRGMVDGSDSINNRNISRRLLNRSPEARFKVSLAAVGEVMAKMAESRSVGDCSDAGAELRRLMLRGRLVIGGFGKDGTAFALANDLMKKDDRLTPADSIIVACAFVDPDCSAFVTDDDMLLGSRVLKAEALERGIRIISNLTSDRSARGSALVKPSCMNLRMVLARGTPLSPLISK